MRSRISTAPSCLTRPEVSRRNNAPTPPNTAKDSNVTQKSAIASRARMASSMMAFCTPARLCATISPPRRMAPVCRLRTNSEELRARWYS